MTTAYHIDVHPNPSAVGSNAGQELFVLGLILILILMVMTSIHREVFTRSSYMNVGFVL